MSKPPNLSANQLFSQQLIAWQQNHGRHTLPWQNTRDPYTIWVSEIMLQQTQVTTVIPYYQRFMQRFPSISQLAEASQDEVLSYWSGLGYYSRGRNLHRAAQTITEVYQGQFPTTQTQIAELPGIGRSTAAAIAVFAYGHRHAILDGNVKRVLTRYFGVQGYPGEKSIEKQLWQQAEQLLPQQRIEIYTQALMDLGSQICARTRPNCEICPIQAECYAYQHQQTQQLPAAKPKKTLATRTCQLLIIRHQDRWLLEKRPAKGIWGGLWCLPQVSDDCQIKDYCAATFKLKVKLMPALAPFIHTFTHFKLHITPQPLTIVTPLADNLPADYQWVDSAELAHAPLPQPVKRIIAMIQS